MNLKISEIISLDDQIKGMRGTELKEYIKMKFNHYKSSPQGCIDYIQECLNVPVPGKGYDRFRLWDTQRKMIEDIVTCMFDPNKNMYVLLGSRQCGKTTCLRAISDWATTFYRKYNVVLIHTDDSRGKNECEEFRSMRNLKSKLMYYKPKKNALTHQIFANDSSFQLQSAQKSKTQGDTDTGRGLSINLLWIDEAGSVDLERIESSVFPVTSTTFIFSAKYNIPHIILLSGTANGRVGIGKRFYDLWKSVEPPLNKENKYMGGYLLFWRDIPDKTQEWYESWRATMSERKIHQEFDCVFYGTDQSLFTDDQIVRIQTKSNSLKIKEFNYSYTCPSGYISRGTFFEKIKPFEKYIIGIDVAKGTSNDSSAIEIINYHNLNQVFELTDNKIQHNDLVKLINNICMTLLKEKAQFVISIESNNTGSSVISDLIALNSMYKLLIYKNTIAPDIQGKTNINYHDCKYGVEITGSGNSDKESIRDILIGYIFQYVDKNLESIRSKYLITEIESLEIDKNGRIQGVPHDDSVFALGHCLLIKYRGRVQNIQTIFNSCADILQDDNYSKIIDLSLSNYDDNVISEALEYSNGMNDSIIIGETGLNSTTAQSFGAIEYNPMQSISDQMNFFNTSQLSFNSNGQINQESLDLLRQSLSQQTKIIQEKNKIKRETEELLRLKNNNNPLIKKINNDKNKKESKKSKIKKILNDHISSNNLNYMSQYSDDSDEWISYIIG